MLSVCLGRHLVRTALYAGVRGTEGHLPQPGIAVPSIQEDGWQLSVCHATIT